MQGFTVAASLRRNAAHGLLLVATLIGALTVAVAQPALAQTSRAFAWGDNFRGQLGDGTITNSALPVVVSGLSNVSAVSGGANFSLALLSNGTVMSWGENGLGELGDGTTQEKSEVPVAVSSLSGVTAIVAGGNHSLALLSNGTVMGWGYNAFGQVGDGGTSTPVRTPVAVSGLSEVTAIAAGYNYSLALLRDGTVMSWGLDESGALGKGGTAESTNPTPTPISGLTGVKAIAAGLGEVSTALLSDGTVKDWGYGGQGELGDGTEESSSSPVVVSGLNEVVALPDQGSSMALLANGTVVDWGGNSNGRLGNGGLGESSDAPVKVIGLSGVIALAGGLEHRLALLGNGTVMAWGGGELGDGSTNGSSVPVLVSGLNEATAIGAGQYFSLAANGSSASPSPTITRVSPDRGSTKGGTTVTVTGTGFAERAGATTFTFGATLATAVHCSSTTRCTVKSPPHKAQTVEIRASVNGLMSPRNPPHDRFRYG